MLEQSVNMEWISAHLISKLLDNQLEKLSHLGTSTYNLV